MDTSNLKASDEAAEKVAVGPRVTLEHLESIVVSTKYWHPPNCEHMTICVLTSRNGYAVVGQSAPADPANFNVELGHQLAFEDALKKLWPLEGYLLRERLHEQG